MVKVLFVLHSVRGCIIPLLSVTAFNGTAFTWITGQQSSHWADWPVIFLSAVLGACQAAILLPVKAEGPYCWVAHQSRVIWLFYIVMCCSIYLVAFLYSIP